MNLIFIKLSTKFYIGFFLSLKKETVTKEVVDQTPKRVEVPEIESNGSFEGIITYEIVLQTKADIKKYAPMKKIFGDTLIVTFSKGRYAMQYPDGRIEYIKYLRDNHQYRKMIFLDTLYFTNASIENSTIYSSLKEETDFEVLGRKLNMISIVSSKFKKYYYFDPNMYMNPEYFKKHKLGYDSKYYELAKAPYIYAEIEYDDLKVILKAINIEERAIPESFFKLPEVPTKVDEMMGK